MTNSMVYFEDGDLVAKSNEVKVYQLENELFLELGPGHNLWALESELSDYTKQLWDKPYGDCLEIGLGLGMASRYILSCPKVTSLTTVEINEDVIAVQDNINSILNTRQREEVKFSTNKKHLILNADGLYYAYETKKRYDFIFLDFYAIIDEDTLPQIIDMAQACKRLLKFNGNIVGWFDDATPAEFVKEFNMIFDNK